MIELDRVSSDQVSIVAPVEFVWQVLVDFDHYAQWNSFCPGIEGELKLGAAVHMQVDMGDGPQLQVEYITQLEPPRVITWSMQNKPGDPIQADRSQYLAPVDAKNCKYLTVDVFSGAATASTLASFGQIMEDGFNRCAYGLKERAEALYRLE